MIDQFLYVLSKKVHKLEIMFSVVIVSKQEPLMNFFQTGET